MHTQSVECPACGRIVKGYQPALHRWPSDEQALELDSDYAAKREQGGYTWIIPYRHKVGEGAWWAMPGEWCTGSTNWLYVGKDIT